LPADYNAGWVEQFAALIEPDLTEGASILDVGSGRRPALAAERRTAGCRYVALDASRAELDAAPSGAYNELVVGDVARRIPALESRFDLAISWQVLEHVKPLAAALENIRSYLRPDGHFVGQLSGRYALFSIAGRVLPHRVGTWGMRRLLGRDPESVFPAWYDRCYYDALVKMLEPWSSWEIVPRYCGAGYLGFAPALQRPYLLYENWAARSGRRNLATHYLLSAWK
jgi:SAM-dependent methyltransferase